MKVVIPIQQNPWLHWSQNDISFLYVYDTLTYSEDIINKTHNDLEKGDLDTFFKQLDNQSVIYRKKCLDVIGGYDLELLYWLKTNLRIECEYNSTIRQYWNWYSTDPEVNNYIPIVKWLEFCKDLKDSFIAKVKSIDEFNLETVNKYQSLIQNLALIESNGLYTIKC